MTWDKVTYGERRLLLRLRYGDGAELRAPGADRSRAAACLATLLRRRRVFAEVVPAFSEVLVTWSGSTSEAAAHHALDQSLAVLPSATPPPRAPRVHSIGVEYSGPDLRVVADHAGISLRAVIAFHTSRTYDVQAVGFQPGFGYLGPVTPELRIPRRASPRSRVPAGSVAIAAGYTAVYPHDSPGGWHIIGTTQAALFTPAATGASALLCVGDQVRFVELSPG